MAQSSPVPISDSTFALPKSVRVTAAAFLILTAYYSFVNFALMHFATPLVTAPLWFFVDRAYFLRPDPSASLFGDVATAVAATVTNCTYFVFVLSVAAWDRARLWWSVGAMMLGIGCLIAWGYFAALQSLAFRDFLEYRYAGEQPWMSGIENLGLVLTPLLGIVAMQIAILSLYLRRR